MIFYMEDVKEEEKTGTSIEESGEKPGVVTGEVKIYSPLKGETIKLENVEDEAFSSGILGKGVAVMPEEGVLYAPVDGTISALFPTGHAVGMTMDNGVELLMHVGMDTVQLEGKGFQTFTAVGDWVKQGYSLVTPVLVVNAGETADVAAVETARVQTGDELIIVSGMDA